jgi:mannitol/fructose-specific phosphotransferase system IIA component
MSEEDLVRFDGYERGIASEQQRVIAILRALPQEFTRKDEVERLVATAIKRIEDSSV